MHSIESRIRSLADTLERRRQLEAEPVDPLSAALDDFDKWLLEVEDPGTTAETLDLTAEQFAKMQDYTRRFRRMAWTFRG